MNQNTGNYFPRISPSLVIGILLIFCTGQVRCNPGMPFSGYWAATLPDSWEVCYRFTPLPDESYSAAFVTYLNGLQYTATLITGPVNVTNQSIQFSTNPRENIVFTGHLDQSQNKITGFLQFPDGDQFDFTLERTDNRYKRAFQPGHRQDSEYSGNPKANPADGLPVSTLEQEGLSREMADSLVAAILLREVGEIHAVLLAKNGKLVLEEYFYDYDSTKPHRIHSCTKSIVSLLNGIGMDAGLSPNLEQNLAELLPNLSAAVIPRATEITWENLLNMTSGLGFVSLPPYTDELWIENILTAPSHVNPGTFFNYNDNNSHLIGWVLTQRFGTELDTFANQYLFKPLDIQAVRWERYANNSPQAHLGIALPARDLLKIGLLVLNEGMWQGNRVIPADWLKQSTAGLIPVEGFLNYGYHWWNLDGEDLGLSGPLPLAQGDGGQRLFLFPKENAAAVVFGGNFEEWFQLDDYIIPVLADHMSSITIEVMTENHSDRPVYVTGDHSQLGLWNPGIIPLEHQGNDNWRKTFLYPQGRVLNFKLTRGSWDSEAVDTQGDPLENFHFKVESDSTIQIVIEGWKDQS